jgi:hypothetical protein
MRKALQYSGKLASNSPIVKTVVNVAWLMAATFGTSQIVVQLTA